MTQFVPGLALCQLLLLAPATSADGGDHRVFSSGRQAFSLPAANLPAARQLDFRVGNSFFRNPWVIAPATTVARDGLGPLYNTNACQNCHIRNGRGHAPSAADLNAVSLLVRLSIDADGSAEQRRQQVIHGVVPEPTYGEQLQDFAIPGVAAEGQVRIDYQYHWVTLADGERVELRQPSVQLQRLNYGPLHPTTRLSARIAPPMIGLGLLDAVDSATLEALADPDDRDGDGISGRVNRVWDRTRQRNVAGRYGWKAGQPNLRQQVASALHGDLGLTNSLYPEAPCSATQTACQQAPDGGRPEVENHLLDYLTFYSANLGVPAQRRPGDAEVMRGRALFTQLGCAACHTPELITGNAAQPWLRQQTIAPYSDLLLHDMGPGLADRRPEFAASGSEWRTPPLWGIGLTAKVGGQQNFLHDGRARSLLEAILWHAGEARASRDKVIALPPSARQALLTFLQSL